MSRNGQRPPKGGTKSITDSDASIAFLKALFEFTERPINLCVLLNSDLGNRAGPQATSRDPTPLEKFITRNDIPDWGNYFCVSTMKNNELHHAKDSVFETPALHADIDLKDIIDGIGPEDKDEGRRQRLKDDIVRKLMQLKHPPSLIVDSLNGIHAYWKFKEAFIYSEDGKDRAEQIDRVENALKLLCDLVGGDFKVTQPSAVMRLPGSHNSKFGNCRKVVVVEQNDKRYELDDLEEWLGETSPIILRKERPQQQRAGDIDVWKKFADQHKPPIDVEQRLADMMYMGEGNSAVHTTQVSVSASLLSSGVDIEEVVEILMAATQAAAGDYWQRWNKKREERNIRNMCETWLKKHPEILEDKDNSAQPNDPVSDGMCFDPFNPFEDVLAPDLPKGALPELIENVAFDEGRRMGVDPGVLAMSMLTMCAGIIPDQLRLKVKRAATDGWFQSARAWTGIVGTASTKKSAGMSKAVEPVTDIDDILGMEYDKALAQYKKDKAAKDEEAEPPIEVRVKISNITPEKISTLQAANPQGLIYACAELVSIFGNLDRYSSKSGGAGKSARGQLLSAFDGISETVDREGRRAPRGKGSGISIFGGIQPGVISSLVDEGSKNDGLVNRFNFVYAKPYGDGLDTDIDHPFTEYDELIENLYKHMPLAHGADFHFSDTALQFKEIAFGWIKIQIRLAEDNNDQQFASHLGKWENIFVRYCLLFHVIDHWQDKHTRAINQETVKKVDRLMRDYLIPHSVAFYRALGSDEESDQLKRACKHILICGMRTISVRELQLILGRHKGITSKDMERVGSKLQTWGWLVRVRGKRNQHNSIQWAVRDEVFTKFAKLIPGFMAELETIQKRMKADFEARRKADLEGKK